MPPAITAIDTTAAPTPTAHPVFVPGTVTDETCACRTAVFAVDRTSDAVLTSPVGAFDMRSNRDAVIVSASGAEVPDGTTTVAASGSDCISAAGIACRDPDRRCRRLRSAPRSAAV